MIIMIDNYDSFTYNLVQGIEALGVTTVVYRNDAIDVAQLQAMMPSAIILSPGPCTPMQAGISMDVVLAFQGKIPIWGVCLGHQAIIQAFQGKIIRAKRIMHGKTSMISHNGRFLFKGLQTPLEVGRYHSLIASAKYLPDCFDITATSEDQEIMAVQHKKHAIFGVQFHPESILTPAGEKIMQNFLAMI